MKKEFVMRGKTASGEIEILEFGGRQKENKNMAYRLVGFQVYPSTNVAGTEFEGAASLTAAKVAEDPINPNFNNEALIGTAACLVSASSINPATSLSIVNDTFNITQNLILKVNDTSNNPVNWQCRFEAVKMTDAETAATNFKQYTIFDE